MQSSRLKSTFIGKFVFLFIIVLYFPSNSLAFENTSSITTIINQVRGDECCDVGSVNHLNQQIRELNKHDLKATFTIRYDALNNHKYTDLFIDKGNHELGLLLEITPLLASESGVQYSGDDDSWHEAQNVFLIGYSQESRKKLIDTAVNKFIEVFGYAPKITGSWMIDSWSLKYLREKYGTIVHQITREQFSTDSYSLYGGPPHYPYQINNWALIPSDNESSSGLMIIRQTVSDPVRNYGDTTNSFTSQPNDYQLTNKDFTYFKYLFEQAHKQKLNPYTFANLGLENSMSQEYQDEYLRQLDYLSKWDDVEGRFVLTSSETYSYLANVNSDGLRVYAGSDLNNNNSKSWWITSNNYRARLRKDKNKLYISDLRIYDPRFNDPYFEKPASRLGWWIVPFVLDGSRFQQNKFLHEKDRLLNDQMRPWWNKNTSPTQIQIANINEDLLVSNQNDHLIFTSDGKELAIFEPDGFSLIKDSKFYLSNDSTSKLINNLNASLDDSLVFGFKTKEMNNHIVYTPYVLENVGLSSIRNAFPKLLFPELGKGLFSKDRSHVYINNQFAIAGRNPIRLVFYPKNDDGFPIVLLGPPTVDVSDDTSIVEINESDGKDGSYFIDIFNDNPNKVVVDISTEGFRSKKEVYFAPNCLSNTRNCLKNPKYLYWYVREKIYPLFK